MDPDSASDCMNLDKSLKLSTPQVSVNETMLKSTWKDYVTEGLQSVLKK